MQSVQLLCVGNLKEAFWRAGSAEYEKRLGAYCKLKTIELPEAKLHGESDSAIAAVLNREGEKFLPYLAGCYNIALCLEGEQITSPALAQLLSTTALQGHSRINLLIGGSWGLSEEVKSRCERRISLGGITLPHQLCRLVVLEQLYRSYTILAGTGYHK